MTKRCEDCVNFRGLDTLWDMPIVWCLEAGGAVEFIGPEKKDLCPGYKRKWYLFWRPK